MWALTNKNMTWKQKRLGKKIINYCKKHGISLEYTNDKDPDGIRHTKFIRVSFYKGPDRKHLGDCIFTEGEVYSEGEKVYEILFASLKSDHEKHLNTGKNCITELCDAYELHTL